jgi:AhpD family alkylhydroperoxidase
MRSLLLFAICVGPTLSTHVGPKVSTHMKLRGGGKKAEGAIEPFKTGKLWNAKAFIRDHVTFASLLPSYLGAYIGNAAIEPKVSEAVMLTVNSINTCPYCTGLHGQLARMASTTTQAQQSSPAVVFAAVFAEEGGRGSAVDAAYTKLVSALGQLVESGTKSV